MKFQVDDRVMINSGVDKGQKGTVKQHIDHVFLSTLVEFDRDGKRWWLRGVDLDKLDVDGNVIPDESKKVNQKRPPITIEEHIKNILEGDKKC